MLLMNNLRRTQKVYIRLFLPFYCKYSNAYKLILFSIQKQDSFASKST